MDVLYDELYRDFVVSPARYYDVRVHHERRDVIIKGRLHVFTVLLQYTFQISASLRDVPPQAPGESDVSVGIDKNLHVAHLKEALTFHVDFSISYRYGVSDSGLIFILSLLSTHFQYVDIVEGEYPLEDDDVGTVHGFLMGTREEGNYEKYRVDSLAQGATKWINLPFCFPYDASRNCR